MTDDALTVTSPSSVDSVRKEFGPVGRALARRFFEPVRFPQSCVDDLSRLSQRGFVVHVMRTTTWINYLYLHWALVKRGLPPIRAAVNLRPWYTRPFTLVRRTGDFGHRFEEARRAQGSALVFLREAALFVPRGIETRSDPFPALVELARRSTQPVFLVPELLVWEKRTAKLEPTVVDQLFGSPEAPGFLHAFTTFLRNYNRAQFRMAEPVDLSAFVADNAGEPTATLARKVRSALHHHLARQTRAVFGPPIKSTERLIEEAMRDRVFQTALETAAKEKNRTLESVRREARRNFDAIAARFSPTMLGLLSPVLTWVFNRIYDGMEVDEAGLDRAMKMAASAPVVLTPSHKSHLDYLIMSYVLWRRGYMVPLVAAGANLSFWPLGGVFRRGGAFFLRRSFKGDQVYTATFKAYLKKLVHDGIHHEFFPEGGRSRTGKLLQPKLGLFTWLTDAVLEGARDDLLFVPVSIDYEKVVEGASYQKELAGGEKRPEDFKALLSAPRVLAENYGRIHLTFDEPVSLKGMIHERGLERGAISEDQKKALVRSLAHRVMFGISRASTVTPHALLASALLAHRRRGIAASEVTRRIDLLRRIASDLGAPLSRQLHLAPSSPTGKGPVADAMHMFASGSFVHIAEAKGEPIYRVDDDRRAELSFYKNTLLNLVAGRTIVSAAVLAAPRRQVVVIREHALFLSRLFKLEFLYPVGKTFEHIFDETVEHLERLKLLAVEEDTVRVDDGHPLESIQFLADLLRDYLESYLLAVLQVVELPPEGVDRKEFLSRALDLGRAEYLSGRLSCAESLSKTNLENAVAYFLETGVLVEKDKVLRRGTTDASNLLTQLKVYTPQHP